MAAVETVEDPRGERGAEVLVERRHGTWLDAALPPGAHRVLGAVAHRFDERRELAEVVGAVRVAHHDVLAANVGDGVDVGAAQPAAGGVQDPGSALQGQLWCCVVGAVNDQDLAAHARIAQPLVAPGDEVLDGDLLVDGRHEDRDLGLGLVVLRHQQRDLGVGR